MRFLQEILYLTSILSIGCVLCHHHSTDTDDDGTTELQQEKALRDALVSSYHKKVAPAKPVILKYGISPVKVIDVDASRGLATIDIWLRHHWQEQRLAWNFSEYHVDALYFHPRDVYVPEMALYNGILTPTVPNPHLVVLPSGEIIYYPAMRAEVYCQLPPLPFTNVVCPIVIGPWSHNVRRITLDTFDPMVDTSFLQETGKCKISESWAELRQSNYTCCPETFATMILFVRMNCSEDELTAPAAESLKGAPEKAEVHPETRQKCSLPLVITPFFVLLIFLLPPKATDRVFLGLIVFAALLLIWTSNTVPGDEERFLQLSAILSISSTFASLVPCKLSSGSTLATQLEVGKNGPKSSRCKNRLATMIDLILFAAVAIFLGVSTVGTFA